MWLVYRDYPAMVSVLSIWTTELRAHAAQATYEARNHQGVYRVKQWRMNVLEPQWP